MREAIDTAISMLETAISLAETDEQYLTAAAKRSMHAGHVLDAARADHRRTEVCGKLEGLRLGLGQVRHIKQKFKNAGS